MKKTSFAKGLLQALLLLPLTAFASGAEVHLDRAPVNFQDKESLQRGAAVFVNYCLSCHSANAMRYSRMTDIGLTESQIKDNLLYAADKPGNTMTVAMRSKEAKAWFGATPPDLSVITRSRGSDWVYTYLRGFYRDDTRPTGWNNTVFDKVGMPHVLHDLQGQMVPVYKTETDHEGKTHHVIERLELAQPGKLTLAEYDATVGDLVNYMSWMGEPAKAKRLYLGVGVMLFLFVFFIVAFYLKREFWKDVH
ncbi:ubiquinol-cytochrome c reductase cytochrome c1 subunit [Sulfuritortus calidifontis]|uniref:Ubiquinol-cytochrome c reductase cytochrome c1 subunit n=1 Tax=Sulfuritortus calidifontis TaxID=1914471 RepID=A0A4R3JUT8_9PROT|nr:cytochrome c1 [Sulfuritortus calidifontis]TCS71661.1 ubiquinol-cytochrome c reductase cytochrome c1 subunit [Sulfuritortus calidifontis]